MTINMCTATFRTFLANIHKRRLIFIFLIGCFLCQVHAEENQLKQQPIQMSLKEVSLEVFLKNVEKKSGYIIFYNEKILDMEKGRKVSINVKAASVSEILDKVLIPRGLSYTIRDRQIIINQQNTENKTSTILQQNSGTAINGIVMDTNQQPLAGVNIFVEGQMTGTASDADGRFSLKPGKVGEMQLRISCIGFITKLLKVSDFSKELKIFMSEDASRVNEVVVVGYGTQKKVNLTGALTVIGEDMLKDRPVQSLANMLQGVAPGVNVFTSSGRPGNSASVNIRGVGSISSTGAPLILVDGVEGDLAKVNPNDVATISVLKDASAAAIYGARAAFGVVLVTTKQGDKSGKTQVSYSGRFGKMTPTTSTDYETRGYYSVMLNDLFMKSYSGVNYSRYTEEDYQQLWDRRNDKTENPDRPWVVIDQRDGRDTYVYYGNTDWYHQLYRDNRPMMSHNINLSGGTEKVQYMLSGGYYKEDGLFRQGTDTYNRYNFRSKISFEINKWFTISNNTSYYNNKYNYPGVSGVNTAFSLDKVHALASFVPTNPDGSSVVSTSFTNYQIMDGLPAMLNYGKDTNTDINNNLSNMTELTYKPMKGLTLQSNFNYTFNNNRYQNRQVNVPYSKYPGETLTLNTGNFIDKLSESSQISNYYALNVFGTYEKKYKDNNFKLMLGYNWERKYLKDINVIGYDLLSETLNDIKLVGTDADGNVRYEGGGGQNEYAIMGSFVRFNYDYNSRYLAEISGRYDGTSRFKRGQRFQFFPSFSLGWRVSEEEFFAPVTDFITNFKVRFSYGSLGNQQVGYYDYLQTLTPSTLSYLFGGDTKSSYLNISDPVASNLTWETVESRNLGVDMTFLKNKLEFTGDLYQRDTKNMLYTGKVLPATYGATPPKENCADLRTKGYELSLNWKDSFRLFGKPLAYSLTATFSDYVSEITKIDNPDKSLSYWYEGQRLGEIWGYRIDGYFKSDEEAASYTVDQTSVNAIINSSAGAEKGVKAGDLKFRDLDGNSIISLSENRVGKSGDREIIGNDEPRYHYGFTAGASWSGIDFSVFFQGIGKQDWYPGANCMAFWGPYARPYATYIPKNFNEDIWSKENPNAYFPRPRGYVALQGTNRELTATNDKYLQDIGYLRLKNVTVGYSLPRTLTQKLLIDKIRLYFSGENLGTWTKLRSDYLDPEQCATGGSGSLARIYPWARTFTFGIDVTF